MSPTPKDALGEPVKRQISPLEKRFMTEVAVPQLNAVSKDETLKHFADVMWNLCSWEKDRTNALDSKATSLLGLSSIAATIVTVAAPVSDISLPFRILSLTLFLAAIALAVVTLSVQEHGGFLDTDVFMSLTAGTKPVGDIPAFTETDELRGYLRETALQRWLIYRWYKSENNTKAKWTSASQFCTLLAVLSLFAIIVRQIL